MRKAAIAAGSAVLFVLLIFWAGTAPWILETAWGLARSSIEKATGVRAEVSRIQGNAFGRLVIDSLRFGRVARIERISVGYRPLDFLFRGIALRRVRVEGLSFFPEYLADVKLARGAPGKPGRRTRFYVDHIELVRGRAVSYPKLPELSLEHIFFAGRVESDEVVADTVGFATRRSEFQGKGRIGLRSSAALDFRFALRADLSDLVGLVPSSPVSGVARVTGQTFGTLGRPRLEADLRLVSGAWQGWQVDSLRTQVSFDPDSLRLEELVVSMPAGRLAGFLSVPCFRSRWDETKAMVLLDGTWAGRPARLDLSLTGGRLALSAAAYDVKLRLGGNVAGTFHNPRGTAQLEAAFDDPQARLSAEFGYARPTLEVTRLVGTGRSSSFSASGSVSFVSALPFRVALKIHAFEIAEWCRFLPGRQRLEGTLGGELVLAGRRNHYSGRTHLWARGLAGHEERIDSLALTGSVAGTLITVERLWLARRQGELVVTGKLDVATLATEFSLSARDLDFPYPCRMAGIGLPLGMSVSFDLTGGGRLIAPNARGIIRLTDFVTEGMSWGNVAMKVDLQFPKLRVESAGLPGELAIAGEIDFEKDFPFEGTCRGEHVPLKRLLGQVTGVYPAEGALSLAIRARGTAFYWRGIEAELILSELAAKSPDAGLVLSRPCTVLMAKKSVTISNPLQITLVPQGRLQFGGYIDVAPETTQADFVVHLADFDLAFVRQVMKGMPDLSGPVTVNARIAGPTRNPGIDGDLVLTSAFLHYPAAGLALDSVKAKLLFSGRRIVVEKFTGHLGAGTIKMVGSLNLVNFLPKTYVLRLAVTQGELKKRREWSVVFNANLKLAGTLDSTNVAGRLEVGSGEYTAPFDPVMLAGLVGHVGRPTERIPYLSRSRLDLGLEIPGTFELRNNIARLAVEADLEAKGSFDRPILSGRVAGVPGGTISYLGRTFEIVNATCDFADPYRLNPDLAVQAQAQVVAEDTFLVTMNFEGRPEDWRLELSSEPPLAEPDIVSLLVLGRTRGLPTLSQSAQKAADVALNAIEGTIERRLADFLGLEQFRLEGSVLAPESLRLGFEKRLWGRVTVNYSTALESIDRQRISLSYDLNRNIAVVSSYDQESANVGADVDFHIRLP